MSKQKTAITEFRSYSLCPSFPVFLLTGEKWRISDHPSDHLHFHNCMELGFCHEGSGILRIRNEDWNFQGSNVTCIARNIPHTTFSTRGTKSLWSYVYVDINDLFDIFIPSALPQIHDMINTLSTALIITEQDSPEIRTMMSIVIRELLDQTENYQLKVRVLLLSMFLEMARTVKRQPRPRQFPLVDQNHTLVIVPALEYMKKNYMNQFPVEQLADFCGLSATHFRRIFNQIMGMSPLEYLNTLRIKTACHLLRSTEDSILNISEQVGFRSISSFNRYFDRLVGMAPRDYRKTALSDTELQTAKIMKYNGWLEPELL